MPLTGKKCPREGLRVRYVPNPVSRALDAGRHNLQPGDLGSVQSMPLGGRRATCMGGPGGGLVYVRWDSGDFFGVSRLDLELATMKSNLSGLGMFEDPDGKMKWLYAYEDELRKLLAGREFPKHSHHLPYGHMVARTMPPQEAARRYLRQTRYGRGVKLDGLGAGDPTHVCAQPLCTKGIRGDEEYCAQHKSSTAQWNDAMRAVLANLYHLARTALSKKGVIVTRHAQQVWAADVFSKIHPEVSSTAAYKELDKQSAWRFEGLGDVVDNTDTVKNYGKCARKCKGKPHVGACIDKCVGAPLNGSEKIHPRSLGIFVIQKKVDSVTKRAHFSGKEAAIAFALREDADLVWDSTNEDVVWERGDKTDIKPAPPSPFAGSPEYHARSAQTWTGHALDEAQDGAADALQKGQCRRALHSLIRAERKTTMGSHDATQTGDPKLKERARTANHYINTLWAEFQEKCTQGETPSVSPFEGLGGMASGVGTVEVKLSARAQPGDHWRVRSNPVTEKYGVHPYPGLEEESVWPGEVGVVSGDETSGLWLEFSRGRRRSVDLLDLADVVLVKKGTSVGGLGELGAVSRQFPVGTRVRKTMGVRQTGVVVAPFYWKEATDGTYRAPEPKERVVFVGWDDGTKGWIHVVHAERIGDNLGDTVYPTRSE